MNATPLPDPRIAAIYRSGLFDRAGSEQFGHLTEHVRVMLGVPVAIISIVDEDRQVFAGHCGLPEPWASIGETPMSHSFCQHVVAQDAPLIVEDARLHALVQTNDAIGDLGVVAYLGVPIRLPGGQIVGALAAIDTQARPWTEHDRRCLESLATIVEKEIEVGVSEILYRTLFQEMQEGYYVASAIRNDHGALVDILFEEVNPAFQRLTDLPPEQVVGRTLSAFAPETLGDMLPAYDAVLRNGQPVLHANQATALGGRWYENRIRRIGPDRLASVFAEVTDRKVAEGLLMESEAYWRGLFEQLEEGFILGELIRDADGRVIDWRYKEVNGAWGRFVGIPSHLAAGRTIREVFPGIEDEWVMEFAHVVETGKPAVFVRQVGAIDRWYEGHAQPLDAERFIVLFLDVTERVRLEGELRDRERQLRTVIDTMPVGVLLAEAPSGRIVIQNGRMQQLLGQDVTAATSVADYGIFVATHPDGSPFDTNHYPLTRIMAGECTNARVEVLYHRPDGCKAWVSIIGEAILDESGGLSGAIVAVTDISDRKRTEAEADLRNREMAHRLKNMLAMVQAISSQTLRSVTERHHVQAFEKRLHALSGAHDVLLRDNHDAAPVDAIVSTTLQRIAPSDRIDCSGPRTIVGPKCALSLALLLHELGTNAVKYGALSNEAGRVLVRWSLEGEGSERLFDLLWEESDGPFVQQPGHRGFGSKLVRMGLIGAGGVEIDYHPSGLRVSMKAPLSELQQTE